MKKNLLILLFLLMPAVPVRAAFTRSVDSTWPEKQVVVDGRGTEWKLFPVLETKGFSFRAMNDGATFYFLISAVTDDGRTILAGTFRQDVTLWVLDAKTDKRLWGIRIPFGARESKGGEPNPDNSTLASLNVKPQKVVEEGIEISSGPLPAGATIQGDLSSEYGRKPVIEMGLPLEILAASRKGDSVRLEFTADPINPAIKREVALLVTERRSSNENRDQAAGEGGHRRRSGGPDSESPNRGNSAGPIAFPDAVRLPLKVNLVVRPPR